MGESLRTCDFPLLLSDPPRLIAASVLNQSGWVQGLLHLTFDADITTLSHPGLAWNLTNGSGTWKDTGAVNQTGPRTLTISMTGADISTGALTVSYSQTGMPIGGFGGLVVPFAGFSVSREN